MIAGVLAGAADDDDEEACLADWRGAVVIGVADGVSGGWYALCGIG